jgi:hypothetical protein
MQLVPVRVKSNQSQHSFVKEPLCLKKFFRIKKREGTRVQAYLPLTSTLLSPLRHSGNYIYQLVWHFRTANLIFCFIWFSRRTLIIFIERIKRLVFLIRLLYDRNWSFIHSHIMWAKVVLWRAIFWSKISTIFLHPLFFCGKKFPSFVFYSPTFVSTKPNMQGVFMS